MTTDVSIINAGLILMSLCQKAGVSLAHSFEEWGLSHQKVLKPSCVIPNLHYNPCLILRSGSDASPCGTALRMLVATWNFFRYGHQHPVLELGHLDIALIVVPIVAKLCKYWRTVCPVTAMHMRIVLSSAERWWKALCRTVGVLNNGAKILGCGKHYGMENGLLACRSQKSLDKELWKCPRRHWAGQQHGAHWSIYSWCTTLYIDANMSEYLQYWCKQPTVHVPECGGYATTESFSVAMTWLPLP